MRLKLREQLLGDKKKRHLYAGGKICTLSHFIRTVFCGFLTVTLNRIRERADNCLKHTAQPCRPHGQLWLDYLRAHARTLTLPQPITHIHPQTLTPTHGRSSCRPPLAAAPAVLSWGCRGEGGQAGSPQDAPWCHWVSPLPKVTFAFSHSSPSPISLKLLLVAQDPQQQGRTQSVGEPRHKHTPRSDPSSNHSPTASWLGDLECILPSLQGSKIERTTQPQEATVRGEKMKRCTKCAWHHI